MYQKPKGFNTVGIIQCFLALFFVIWFLLRPDLAIYFAWPIDAKLTAMFLGAGFMLRTYIGYHLWREKDWYKLRWVLHGDLAFLSVLFIATWWHIDKMNWHRTTDGETIRIFCLIMAHIWTLAYTFEPITVWFLSPRGEDKARAEAPVPAELSEGPILPFTKTTLVTIFYLGAGIAALLFFNPTFADTRWPWAFNIIDPQLLEMDGRIMAAFPIGAAVWAITMYFMKDWAEIKIGIRALTFFLLGLFGVALFSYATGQLNFFDITTRHNQPTFGIVTFIISAMILYSYWKQEAARPKKAA